MSKDIELTKVTALGDESKMALNPDDVEDVYQDDASINHFTLVKLSNGDEFWVLESVDEVLKAMAR